MPRPPIEYREERPSVGDHADVARGVTETSRNLNELANRTARDVKTKTSAYTMDPLLDRIIFATGTTTITLPDAAEADFVEYVVVKTDAGGTTVTVDTGGGNINGAGSVGITTQHESVRVASDGTNYFRTDIDA